MFENKTFKSWLFIFLIGIFTILLFASLDKVFELGLKAFIGDIIQFLGLGGLGNTARNTVTDGIMPRVVQAQQAKAMGPPEPLNISTPNSNVNVNT